jgi:hypothetical protein
MMHNWMQWETEIKFRAERLQAEAQRRNLARQAQIVQHSTELQSSPVPPKRPVFSLRRKFQPLGG